MVGGGGLQDGNNVRWPCTNMTAKHQLYTIATGDRPDAPNLLPSFADTPWEQEQRGIMERGCTGTGNERQSTRAVFWGPQRQPAGGGNPSASGHHKGTNGYDGATHGHCRRQEHAHEGRMPNPIHNHAVSCTCSPHKRHPSTTCNIICHLGTG